MRVLHAANFSWFSTKKKRADNLARYYSTDRKISNGFVRNGCCVWDFSYRDAARHLSPVLQSKKFGATKMNAALVAQARAFAPDLILLGHCELITPQTLAELRRILPDAKIAQWWVDWFAPHSLPHLRAKQKYLDAFFATTAPEYYAPLLESKTPSYYLPNIVDSGIETGRTFDGEHYEYDVFFAGADAPERAAVLDAVQNIPGIRAGFFGFGGRRTLTGAALPKTIAASKIGLNFSRADNIPLYSSDRLAQLTGNGCAAVLPRIPKIEKLFNENEAAYFSRAEEIPPLVAELLADDSRRREIARAGWKRAHGAYNEKRVCKFIAEAAFHNKFGEEYEWLEFSQNAIIKHI